MKLQDMFKLGGKMALVTGGGRGIGKFIAEGFAEAGADLVLASRKMKNLEASAEEIRRNFGVRVLPVACDMGKPEEIDAMIGTVLEKFPRIDILVNNAGCNVRKPALDVTWDDWNLVLDTNLRGTFFVSQAVAQRSMIPQGKGRIINIGSVTCVAGYAGLAPYGASRGGVKQLTMSLADDWGVHGITVNCLAPGWFKTAQNAALYEDREWVAYLCDRIPLKRPGRPNDLDGAIVFLASDASAYITGQTLLVDGGISTGATKAMLNK